MTEVLDPPVTHPVHAAVGDLVLAFDVVASTDLTALSGTDLMRLTDDLVALRRRADALALRVVHAVDSQAVAAHQGQPSTATWLRAAHRLHPAEASRTVRVAKALHDDPSAPLVPLADDGIVRPRQQLRDAFDAGAVSAEHVEVVTGVIAGLSDAVDPATLLEAEQFLVEQAAAHDPKALAHIGKHLRHVLVGPQRLAEEEQHAVATRTFEIREQHDGSGKVRGHLDPELTALLRSQLSPLAAPRAAADGQRDLRTAAQRNADALAELLRRYAGANLSPASHGAAATITVTMALETLERRLGTAGASLDWSGPLSAASARRLACDARLIPVVLGTAGEPLDVGRSSYPVTAAIWRALVARDGGCGFAGCDRPPEWTEAHHIRPWADGGETSVDNCGLFCDFHHRRLHHDGWEVTLIDGVIHVIPPPWVDPDRLPRRNTQRAQLAALVTNVTPPPTTDPA